MAGSSLPLLSCAEFTLFHIYELFISISERGVLYRNRGLHPHAQNPGPEYPWALAELPELRHLASLTGDSGPLRELAEDLDALPRDYAMHPCPVILSNASLLDRLPVQPTPGETLISHWRTRAGIPHAAILAPGSERPRR
jgi:hypothetical protein